MIIGSICSIKTGYAFRTGIVNVPGGRYRVVQPRNVTAEGLLMEHDMVTVSMQSVKAGQILQDNDVLLINRGRFAATVFHAEEAGEYIAAGSLLVLTPKSESTVLPEYLALYLNSAMGTRQLNRLDETTTIPFVSRSNLAQLDIPVPNMETQQKLVALERAKHRYFQLVTRRQRVLDSLINHQLSTINPT